MIMAAACIFVALQELQKQVVADGDVRGCVSNEIGYYCKLLSTPWLSTSSSSCIYGIHQLNKDWSFLNTVHESVSRWSNADEVAFGDGWEKNENVVLMLAPKIEAAAKKIAQNLEANKHYYYLRESEFLDLVLYCQMETQRLMEEVRGSTDHLSGCLFQVHIRPLPLPAGDDFAPLPPPPPPLLSADDDNGDHSLPPFLLHGGDDHGGGSGHLSFLYNDLFSNSDGGGHPSFSYNDWFSYGDGSDHDHPIPSLSDDDGVIPNLFDDGSLIRLLSDDDDDGGGSIPSLSDDDGGGDDVYSSCPDDDGGKSDDVYFSCSDCDDDVDGDDDWFSFWTRFAHCVLLNLRIVLSSIDIQDKDSYITGKQVSTLYKELGLIRDYVLDVFGGSLDLPAAAGVPCVINIDNFFNHVGSVIVRIAIQSCNYWLHYSTKTSKTDPPIEEGNKIKFAKFLVVEELQHEIDFTNPYFVELHLHFFVALSKVGVCQGGNLVDSFCKYYFQRRQGDLRDEVSSLLTCFLESMLHEKEEEVVKSSSEEIKAVLLWMASLFDVLRKEEMKMEEKEVVCLPFPPCSEFLAEICLLKAELILKKVLHHISLSYITLSMISALENQAKDEFNHILQSLRRYIRDFPPEKIEHGKKALAVVGQVADDVASLCQSFEAKKISESMLNNSINSILGLVLKIVIFRTESILMGLLLLKSSGAAKTSMADEDQIPFLLEELNFLKTILSCKLVHREKMNMRFLQIEAFLRGLTCLSYSNPTNKNIAQDMIKKKVLSSCALLDKVKHLKPMLTEIGPQFPLSKLPKMHKMEFIDFLTNLGELLRYFPRTIAPLKHYVEEIQLHLKSLSPLIKVSDPNVDEHPGLDGLGDHVNDIAYKVEYIVDLILDGPQLLHFFWFYHEFKKFRHVNERAASIHLTNSNAKVQNVNDVNQVSLNMISQDGRPAAANEMVVDLSDEERVIINQLTRGSLQRRVVSIVGMPGIGKTTLALKVYNDQNVVRRFHCHAWCYVSQVYEKRRLLLGILGDIHGITDEIRQLSNEDLELKLHQCLLRNKYLIVMDDMWDAGAWNDLKNSFPDDPNGSRILITSRQRDMALEIEPNCDPYSLRPLSGDESWKLLEWKVFQRRACPQELLLVGKEIAQKCEGLPLAIVAISGLLQRTEEKKELWENISRSLSSEIMNDPKARCNEILELSYKHLPGYLKACFLYLGLFLGDRDIPVTKLIRLWLAEGFIQNTESKRLEDVAEAYLVDLINRSLVIISQKRSNGKVKACRLHDLMLDFCKLKAKDENFLQLVTSRNEPYSSFPRSDYGFEFDFYHQSGLVEYKVYRLSILLKRNHFVESRPSGLGTRSLIFFATIDSEPRCPYDISFVCHKFKFLRVLDFECINIGISFPAEIKLLVLLRYLAVSGYLHYIPKSIANLSWLETLIVKGLRGKVVLPDTVWGMTRLRHLHVNVHVTFNLDDEDVGDFELENLISFSCPSLSCGDDTKRIMKRLPNLRKLKCIFFESWDSSKNCNQFPRLDFLTKLESVNLFYYGTPLSTSEFNLPLNLKELTLSNFCLPWDCISPIGKLPNLAVLKLLSGAFEGERWDMKEEEFPELKFLKLESLNISQWNGYSDHLPKLQRLVLRNCKDLEKIPRDFADIDTLEMIEVHWCGKSVEDSAKEIGKSTGDIKVLISSSLPT